MTVATGDLVRDLQQQVRTLEDDLRKQVEQLPEVKQRLEADFADANKRGRTAESWTSWLDAQATQAAVSWVLACVFVRFCEDNDLTERRWLAGAGDGLGRAVDAQATWIQSNPRENERGWLREAYRWLRSTRAGASLFPDTDFVWWWDISADAAAGMVESFRRRGGDGDLVHRFDSPDWDTRFLGDLYQDLSEAARKRYALLQTPEFVEEFILDLTLDPAMEEFGVEELRMIDPACGSGHFLLGAFRRLLAAWAQHAPAMDARTRVQKALDAVHGIDVNAGATAIAKFRLMVAALRAGGVRRLDAPDAPAFTLHIATGDSLLRGATQQAFAFEEGDPLVTHAYGWEDIDAYPGILHAGRYHVVVGNPPYITVKDKALNAAYREHYSACAGKYALSVPFAELFFRLARAGADSAGYVGQITSNSFMKREFGKKLIEDFFAHQDLTHVIDSEGAWIPGHNSDGTPTCILVGRGRPPARSVVVSVLTKGKREARSVGNDGKGPYWRSIVEHLNDGEFDNEWVSIVELDRNYFGTHPWSLAGGGAPQLKTLLESGWPRLADVADALGIASFTLEDEVYISPKHVCVKQGLDPAYLRPMLQGDGVRNWQAQAPELTLFPYAADFEPVDVASSQSLLRSMWPYRTTLSNNVMFGGTTKVEAGLRWTEFGRLTTSKLKTPLSIVWGEIASHNHFVLDRGGSIYNRTAPIMKLPRGADEERHLRLVALLNSSTACFWLRNQSKPKGGAAAYIWARTHQFAAGVVKTLPIPSGLSSDTAHRIDVLSQRLQHLQPSALWQDMAPTRDHRDQARNEYETVLAEMVSLQEELDWQIYRLYGLVDEDLTYKQPDLPGLALGQRAFEIDLARRSDDESDMKWFDEHRSVPTRDVPNHWPVGYRGLVLRRLEVIETHPLLRLIETPECKRRWESASWEEMQSAALRSLALDLLEQPEHWQDGHGPRVLTVAQLGDVMQRQPAFRQTLDLYLGRPDYDLVHELSRLVRDEAVPYLASHRYSSSGMRKREEWERTWALQREQDRTGDQPAITVPPKYDGVDFKSQAIARLRGKLDVPKERFVSYPGLERSGDRTAVLGWAGWDHQQQAQALARLVLDRQSADGWAGEQMREPLAGLVELEPWLHLWHADTDPVYGGSPADFYSTFLDEQAHAAGLSRDELRPLAAMPEVDV